MFSLIKQVFIVLLSFSSSFATKYVSLNDDPCMVRPTLIGLSPVKLKYYLFIISLDKCNGSCNVLPPKICVLKKKQKTNVKPFNMITNKNKAKTMGKHILIDCKCKLNSATCNSNQIWNNKTCQCQYKNCHTCKKDYSWNNSTCICESGKYLKIIADTSVITEYIEKQHYHISKNVGTIGFVWHPDTLFQDNHVVVGISLLCRKYC